MISENHLGASGVGEQGENFAEFLSAMIWRMLLFEKMYVESRRFMEIPSMIKVFGYEEFMKLLDDGFLVFIMGGTGFSTDPRMTVSNIHEVSIVEITNQTHHIDSCLAEIELNGISGRQRTELFSSLHEKTQFLPEEAATHALDDYESDLRGRPLLIASAIEQRVREHLNFPNLQVQMDVEQIGLSTQYRIQTNLNHLCGLEREAEHVFVSRALMGIAGLNHRIQLMRSFESVTGFRDNEFDLFEDKLAFLYRDIDPEIQLSRLERVVQIANLPGVAELNREYTVDIVKLIKLRSSDECRDMRRWLRSVDGLTDDEVRAQFKSLKEKVARLVNSRSGEVLRFVTTTALGLVPGGNIIGLAGSLGDQFLVESVIGVPGPVSFLGKEYASLFKSPRRRLSSSGPPAISG